MGVIRSTHDCFIQTLLIAAVTCQLLLSVYISGSSLLNFGAVWLGSALAGKVDSLVETTVARFASGRLALLAFAWCLALVEQPSPGELIALIVA